MLNDDIILSLCSLRGGTQTGEYITVSKEVIGYIMDKPVRSTASPGRDIYEDEINLRDLLLVLWNWRKLVLAIFLVSLVIGTVLSFAASPVYQVQARVSLGNFAADTTNIQPKITPATAKEMLLGSDLREEAWGKGINAGELAVLPVENTNILKITLDTGDPRQGEDLLDKLVALFSEKAGAQYERSEKLLKDDLERTGGELQELNKSIQQTRGLLEDLSQAELSDSSRIQQAGLLDTLSRFTEQRDKLLENKLNYEQKLNSMEGIKVLEKPEAPSSPVGPRKKLNIMIAGVLGLMVGVFAAFAADYFKRNPFVPSA